MALVLLNICSAFNAAPVVFTVSRNFYKFVGKKLPLFLSVLFRLNQSLNFKCEHLCSITIFREHLFID